MTIPTFVAGNVIKLTVDFDPESGTVLLANVTARLRKPGGVEVALTGIVDWVEDAVPVPSGFRVDWASADTDITGHYRIRWESNSPSPKIVVEGASTSFILLASVFATP